MKKYVIKTKEMVIAPVDEENIWEGDWTITLKGEKDVQIGKANFAGEKLLGAVPIHVELDEEYRNKKYGTEVFKLMVDFAFGFNNIYEVKAETDVENDKCRYALEKAGFVHRNTSKGIESFSITKPKSMLLGVYLYIGIVCGLVIGIVVGNTWVGIVIGVVIGLFIGSMLDSAISKEREKVTGRKS